MVRGWRVVHSQPLELAWMVLGYWKWWVMVQVKAFEVQALAGINDMGCNMVWCTGVVV